MALVLQLGRGGEEDDASISSSGSYSSSGSSSSDGTDHPPATPSSSQCCRRIHPRRLVFPRLITRRDKAFRIAACIFDNKDKMRCIMVHKICMCYTFILCIIESAKDFYVHHRTVRRLDSIIVFCVEIPCYIVPW